MYHAAGEQSDPLILDVIVVGAGQAGLATGVLSAAGGCSVLVVRCRRSHRRLVAPSLRFSCALQPSVLQRAAWHGDEGDPEGCPDRDEIAHYLEQYADSFRLPVVLQEGIGRLERRGDHFIGRTTRGRHVASRAVVVATGAFQRSVVPTYAAFLSPGVTQLRGDAYRNPQQVPAGRVLVVGGGGSGRQIARELARSHDVSLSVGGGITIKPQRVLGRDVMVWFDRLGFLRADKGTAKGRFVRAHDSFPGQHLRDSALHAACIVAQVFARLRHARSEALPGRDVRRFL